MVATVAGMPCLSRLKSIMRDLALVAAAAMPDGQIAGIAASAGALLRFGQRLVRPVRRQIVVDQRGLKPQCRCDRSVSLDRHSSSLQIPAVWLVR